MFRSLLNSILLLSFIAVTVNAQQFKATVDRTTVAQNQQFQLYFEFTGGDNSQLSKFNPPQLPGFRILSGPNQSSSIQIINGRTSASITYSYYLVAPNTGEFTINPASVDYKGKTYTTDPVTIKVVQGQTQPQQQDNSETVSQEEIAKNLFIRAETDKKTAYKGEQITITYKLFNRLEIGSPQINKLPQYKSFWAEELQTSQSLSWRNEMFNGQRYQTAVLKRVALFATKDGELSVSPLELNIPVVLKRRRSNRSLFDEFFNDSFFSRRETVEFRARSNELKVSIKPLPENGKPDSFNGAVGDFNFTTSLDKTETETNEPITLKVNISGTGNIKLLDVPELKLPVGFEQYDPKTTESIDRNTIVRGIKAAEYLIVPRIAGVKEIPPVEFSYFNPATRRYKTIESPVYTINVRRGNNVIEPSVSGFSKEDVRLLSEDIRYIKTTDFNLEKKESVETIQGWFWISMAAPLIAFFAFIGIKKRQDKISGNVQLLKYQKAEKNARSRLKNAKKALDINDIAKFHNEVSQALYGYLEDKLNLQKADFTQERALSMLKDRGVNEELVERVKNILDKCEFARFAPQMSSQAESGELHETTIKVIVDLESSILIRK